LQSGQYAARTGVYNVGYSERPKAINRNLVTPRNLGSLAINVPIFAEQLKKAGYITGLYGKWHLGKWGDYHPSKRGFDEAIILDSPTYNGYWEPVFIPPVDYPQGKYMAEYLTDLSLDFIERHADSTSPFYLQLNQFLVHGPLQAPADLITKYEGKTPDGEDKNPTMAAMIECLDTYVGRIMDKIDSLGISDKTLIVFTSDNGGVGGYKALGIKNGSEHTSNLPFKGGKTHLYEGGTRVPMILRWPGVIEAGSQSDEPAMAIDLYPTFVEIAGGQIPAAYKDISDANAKALETPSEFTLDGISILNHLKSGGLEKLVDRDLFWHFPAYCAAPDGPERFDWRSTPHSVVRSGDYKLLYFYHDDAFELYNIIEDPFEQTNLSELKPEVTAALFEKLENWQRDTRAQIPYRKKCNNTGLPLDLTQAGFTIGIHGVNLTPEHSRLQYYKTSNTEGVYIYYVEKGSSAEGAGLMSSDIIVEMNGSRITGILDFRNKLGEFSAGDKITITYYRNKHRTATINL
jgi:arylsulfatase A-like enzyme